MDFGRSDYSAAIQAWPIKREHLAFRVGDPSGLLIPGWTEWAVEQKLVAPIVPHGEPVFLFRGQDRLAPDALVGYAEILVANNAEKEMVDAVVGQARRMERWQEARGGGKMPDVDKGWLR